MSIKALCPLWMTLAVVRPVSVSSQAGRQACSEDAAAGWGPGTGMLCVLFKQWLVSVQAWRSRGKEVAACLHSWIVLWAPQCLMHFCSNIHKCADDPHWCRCSQHCLHPASAIRLNVCLWTIKQRKHWPPLRSSLLWVFAALAWRLRWEIKTTTRLNLSHWDLREGQ